MKVFILLFLWLDLCDYYFASGVIFGCGHDQFISMQSMVCEMPEAGQRVLLLRRFQFMQLECK